MAWVALAHPVDIRLYPARQAWLHMFEAVDPASGDMFYRSKPSHRQRFRRAEFDVRVQTNAAGFRERLEIASAPSIGVVGDSFAFGWGVEDDERFSDRLREAFPQRQIANFAYPNGHSPPYYELFLRNHPQLLPRLLLILVFPFSDLAGDQIDTVYIHAEDGRWIGLDSRDLLVADDGFFVSRSGSIIPRYDGFARLLSHSYAGRILLSMSGPGGGPPPRLAQLGALDRGHWGDPGEQALAHVANLVAMARAGGGEAIVFYVPFGTLAGEYPGFCPYQASVCAELRVAVDPLGERLATWAAERGFRFIDPLPEMRALERAGERLYFETDAHWTPAGHRAVARIIAAYITRQGL